MADNNLPGSPGPVDAPAPVSDLERIAELLPEDPDTDLPEEVEAEQPEQDEGEEPEIDVSDEADEGAEPDGSQDDIKGGRFAPDSAKVTLADGSVITVAELKRNNLFQADYTRKTTEHAREVETFKAERSAISQRAQELNQLGEYLDWYSQNYLPKAPIPPTEADDFIGWHNYRMEKDKFDQAEGLRNYFQSERARITEQATAEQRQQSHQAFAGELVALTSEDPKFWGDTDKMKSFVGELLEKGETWWGLTKEDLGTLRTGKQWKIVRDALRYRKAVEKAPQANKQVQARPSSARRASAGEQSAQSMQAAREQFRRDPRNERATVALIEKLLG